MKQYNYDIRQFTWKKEDNTFYADAAHLCCHNTDGSLHPESFPNRKKQFYITNPKTGGFRRFRFVAELNEQLVIDEESLSFRVTNWHFQSEDGINCMILVSVSTVEIVSI
jgi:hypothetical protein